MTIENQIEKITLSESQIKSEEIFHLLGKRWAIPIIKMLTKHEILGFNQIKNNFQKITATTLSSALKDLEKYQIILKEIHAGLLPTVSYSLTSYGKTLNYISIMIEGISDTRDDLNSQEKTQNEKTEKHRISKVMKKISRDYMNAKNNVIKYFAPIAGVCGTSSGLCSIAIYHTANTISLV